MDLRVLAPVYYMDKARNAHIAKYIANKLKEDQLGEQLIISEIGLFMGGK